MYIMFLYEHGQMYDICMYVYVNLKLEESFQFTIVCLKLQSVKGARV